MGSLRPLRFWPYSLLPGEQSLPELLSYFTAYFLFIHGGGDI